MLDRIRTVKLPCFHGSSRALDRFSPSRFSGLLNVRQGMPFRTGASAVSGIDLIGFTESVLEPLFTCGEKIPARSTINPSS
jgi:hypothetical protein